MLSIKAFSKSALIFWEYLIIKHRTLVIQTFKTFDKFDNMLTGLKFSLLVRSSFLKTWVISTSFISDGSLPNSNDLLNSWCKIDVKMSISSLITFVAMSEFAEYLEEWSYFNSFSFQYVLRYWSKIYCFYFHNGI